MSDLKYFTYMMIFQVVVFLLMLSYAQFNTEINCPIGEVEEGQSINQSGWYNTSIEFSQKNTIDFMRIFSQNCSGIDWWIWLVIFLPMIIGMVVYITPFIG